MIWDWGGGGAGGGTRKEKGLKDWGGGRGLRDWGGERTEGLGTGDS